MYFVADKTCPGGQTPCYGNGECDVKTGLCSCNEGHQGNDCSGNKDTFWIVLLKYLE